MAKYAILKDLAPRDAGLQPLSGAVEMSFDFGSISIVASWWG